MFTNKNKLIGFIALIVVIVLVASTAIALIADGANKKATAEAEKRIEELNKTIEALNNALNGANTNIEAAKTALEALKTQLATTNTALDDAKEMIEKYEALIAAWETATPLVHEHVEELKGAKAEAEASLKYLPEADKAESEKKLNDAYMVAYYTILRSGNVDEMQEVLDNFVAETDEINKNRPDRVLDALIEALERDEEGKMIYNDANDLQLDKIDAYWEANKDVIEQIMNDTEITKPEDKKDYGNVVIPGLKDEFHKALIASLEADFIAAVDAIETPISLETSFADADAKHALLLAALNEGETVSEAAAEKETLLQSYKDLQAKINAAKVAATDLNARIEALQTAATRVNESNIDAVKADVAAWKTTYETEDFKDYVVDFVNEALLAEKETEFLANKDALKAQYDDYAAKLDAVGTITLDSEPALNAAQTAEDTIVNMADLDYFFGETEGYVAIGTLVAELDNLWTEYNTLVADVKAVCDMIDALYPKKLNVTAEEVAALKALADKLEGRVELAEINRDNAAHLDQYNEIMITPAKRAALDKLHEIYDEYYTTYGTTANDRLALAQSNNVQTAAITAATDIETINALGADAYIRQQFDKVLAAEK